MVAPARRPFAAERRGILTLDQLKPGRRACIAGFDGAGPLIQRLMQLGLLEGMEVELVRRAPAGDPIELKLLGYSLSLRQAEARLIRIDPLP